MPMTGGSLDLTHLYQHCLFRSDAQVESHDHVARELSDHDLRWGQGHVDTRMFKADVRQMQIFALHYGAEVQVTPRPFDDFALVHVSLRGAAEVVSDGERVSIPQGRTALIAPRKSLRMWWQNGSEQLILKVPHALMRQGDAAEADAGLDAPFLPPAHVLPEVFDAQWHLLLQSLLGATAFADATPGRSTWIDHFERNVALFLLSHQTGAHPLPPAAQQPIAQADAVIGDVAAARRLDALDDYMRRRLCAPIALVDLARAAGVGVRTLNALCQRYHGSTPMDLLRNMRLDAVRARLLAEGEVSVTQTALEFGFGHLGRFSAYYRERFGELPRETCERRH